jgi:YidC/Oxa1 family membrane protein insertase
VTALRLRRAWIGPILLALVAVAIAACAPGGSTGGSGGPTPTPTPHPPLTPASPTDPFSLLSWAFTPIFQAMFIVLAFVYDVLESASVPGAIGIAIIVLTLLVRSILIPLYRRQLVSQRRMQMLQPELNEIKRRFKGDQMKQRVAQQELMKERGVNPLAGCLPLLLQLPLLFIMYSVFQNGLTNQDPRAMLQVAGFTLVDIDCKNIVGGIVDATRPCIDTQVPLLGDVSRPEILFRIPGIDFGVSGLAIISSVLQLVQSRMMLTPTDPTNDDPNVRVQRQTMLFLPLISILYGGILPAGLFIYWIVATVYSIVQQYLIVGWGAMFPLLGWHPVFAREHTPRFPVAMPPPVDPSTRPAKSVLGGANVTRAAAADKTIRHRERGRQGRRGRRR